MVLTLLSTILVNQTEEACRKCVTRIIALLHTPALLAVVLRLRLKLRLLDANLHQLLKLLQLQTRLLLLLNQLQLQTAVVETSRL